MRVYSRLMILIVMVITVLPAYGANYRTLREKPAEHKQFFGVDAIARETELIAANGSIKYNFEGIRLRYGLEYSGGASMGIEYIPSDSDTQLDIFGSPLELESGHTLGLFLTIGKPVHLRVGWSAWEATLTDVTSGLSQSDNLSAFEIGLGFNTSIGSNFSIYGDYSVRKTDATFPLFVSGNGVLDHDTTLISLGVNYLF